MIDFSYVYIDGQLIRYKIIYSSNLKNIYLTIYKNFDIEVKAPFGTDKNFIGRVVEEKYYKLQEIKNKKNQASYFNLKNNVLSILGKTYNIEIVQAVKNEKFKFYENKIVLFLNDLANKEKVLRRFLLKESKNILLPICTEIINKYNFTVNKISIKWLTSVWGSCRKTKKHLTFSSRLVTFRKEVIEYVIYHELSHLIEANHSQKFWKIVESMCPNYKNLRRELKNFF